MNSMDILKEGSKALGIELTEQQGQQLVKYKELLLEWNEKINLTAITEEKDVMIKHFLDSLSCVKASPLKNEVKIIDVGTGAGFPGIPLKVYYTDIQLTLLDSLNKRIHFLQAVCETLGLKSVEFLHGRAEDYGNNKNYRERYDVAVARAVAELNSLAEYCIPFVKIGGFFIAQKGPNIEEEMKRAEKAIEILGGKIVEKIDIPLPFSEITHNIVIIKKIKQTPTKYPRKAGTPTKNPLL
ncbi:16S rRNA (guanine(527)-N(7))-methyltransferase RsmG [Geosporobacter ferrireducens]|uniref:Ribosomal RNA small subunit methyltransferase G n=1 Tax=Geosporobacter ferrireducens TaxID=1424294 RepID=A0A1D8GQC5_9FIRM|nr:16S rRNA (guanine(527)-N(7))-methyltransferase RsmG [Geosporobacter ferrireducens]AOT73109.1 16S rRNA methyltransferase G [Geosporobacter ferrireducens]MTI57186.1 16S rRNA (guanine(527)-N(7))-methyltransferase RsmG [Geosporobacter ferrireducens]